MKIKSKNRRMFLQGVGGFTLGIPFLSSIAPKAMAQSSGAAKRFIALKSYSTQVITDWYPARATSGYQLRGPWDYGNRDDGTVALNTLIPGQSDHRWASLQDFAGAGRGISNLIDSKFNPLLAKMMLVRGLDFHCDTNHNGGGMLGNFACSEGRAYSDFRLPFAQQGANRNRPTIDQVMAYSSNFYRTGAPAGGMRSLHLACRGYRGDLKDVLSFTSRGNPNQEPTPVSTILNPQEAFDQIFANGGGNNTNIDYTRQSSLLNLVHEDFMRVRNGRRISNADQVILDNFMDRLSDLISGLGQGTAPSGQCTMPSRPPSIPNASTGLSVRESHRYMTDILIAAILCGHTNVATFDIKSGFDQATMVGSPHGGDVPNQWHGSAHSWNTDPNSAAMRQLYEINKWIADTIYFRIIDELNSVQDTNGQSILDNSVVYWGNELGFNHLAYSVPAILAGGASGALQTGRYYDYIQWNRSGGKFSQNGGHTIPGVTQNRMLVTLLQAMDVPASEYEAYNHGEPGYGSGITTGYEGGGHGAWNMSLNSSPLPGMLG